MNPWPGAFTRLHGKTLKVHATRVTSLARMGAAPGEVKAHLRARAMQMRMMRARISEIRATVVAVKGGRFEIPSCLEAKFVNSTWLVS